MNILLNKEVAQLMYENGADITGFADLKGISDNEMPFGVVVGVALPPNIVLSAIAVPNKDYYNEYNRINQKLDELVTLGSEFLRKKGYKANALTIDAVNATENKRAALPAKTVATRAGLGWIGKNGLLVTKRYGSAIRISTLVTNAEFECGEPVTVSKCNGCTMCMDNCPGKAIAGLVWTPDTDRDKLVDVKKCAQTARALCMERIGIEHTICGKCIVICPFTQQYVT